MLHTLRWAGMSFNVIFINGLPATGKYTIGKALRRLLDVPLFHNHLAVDLVTTLFDFGTPAFITLREQIWMSAFEQAGRARRSFIFTFCPDATVDADLVPRLCGVIEAHGGRVLVVELRCTEVELERRLCDGQRGLFGKLTDVAAYRRIKAEGGFDFPLPAPQLRIDTGSVSALDAAQKIYEALKIP